PGFGKAPHLVPWLSDGDDLAADLAVHVPVGVNVDVGLTGLHIRNLSRRQRGGAMDGRGARVAEADEYTGADMPCGRAMDVRHGRGATQIAERERIGERGAAQGCREAARSPTLGVLQDTRLLPKVEG